MTIKKLSKNELQLEESNVTSAFSDCDKMVLSFKKRSEAESFGKKIEGKWTPYVDETYLNGKLTESYTYGEDYYGEGYYWTFENGKRTTRYENSTEIGNIWDYQVICGCIVVSHNGKNEAVRISKLTDNEMWMEYYEISDNNTVLERTKTRR